MSAKINPKDTRIAELESQVKRIAADFDNFRKRSELERKTIFQFAQAQTLLELAPVLDNFQRATEHQPKDIMYKNANKNWVLGIIYIRKQLEQIFESHGVTKIKTTGQLFDPTNHEAVSHEPSGAVPENHIISEFESGYLLDGQVLKPAKVKVSAGPDSTTDPKSSRTESKDHEPTAKQ